jgi:uncharacterized protein
VTQPPPDDTAAAAAAGAERFVDLACLSYQGDSLERRADAAALLAREPGLVDASIHAAAAAGDLDALRTWLEREPTLLEQPGGPRTWVPLLSLCYSRVPQRDAIGCLELLLGRGADPNAFTTITDCRFTALTGVMGEGEQGPVEQPPHPDAHAMALRLLGAGASPNESQGLYNTHFLPSNAWLELLFARGLTSDIDFLLGQAAQQGFEDRVALLLAHGAAPGGRNHYNKRTHLENALLEGHLSIAAQLERAGAQLATFTGADAFRAECLRGDAVEARRLVAVDPTVAKNAGTLAAAARHGRLDALVLALSLGAPIDAVDHGGLTALHHAARAGHLEIAEELVSRGASLAIKDPQYGGTALGHARHFASRWPAPGRDAVVAFLSGVGPL